MTKLPEKHHHHHLGGHTSPWMHKTMGLGVCKEIEDHDERTTCQVVSRFAMRLMHDDMEKGLDSASVCDKLVEKKYIKLADVEKKTA